MNKIPVITLAVLCAFPTLAQASAMKSTASMKGAKMVTLYKAAKCGMYFTPTQAKKYKMACPDSHGKMSKVMVSPAVAKAQIAKTNMELAPKKTM